MAKIAYNVDTNTKLLDMQKQFLGGLKTVDTDDSLSTVYLRQAENISLSEFGFLEKRYGIIGQDLNIPAAAFTTDFGAPLANKIQGYFEYRAKIDNADIFDRILFINGRLWLSQTGSAWKEITSFYINPDYVYPQADLFSELGFNPTISSRSDSRYILQEDVSAIEWVGRTPFLENRDGELIRRIEATRIDDILYIFTGLYPIKYIGNGVFEPFDLYIPTFTDLQVFSHNIMIPNQSEIYAVGDMLQFEQSGGTADQELTKPSITDFGFRPYIANIQRPGEIFEISVKYSVPTSGIFSTPFESFTNFLQAEPESVDTINHSQIVTQSQTLVGTGGYLEMFPRVFYRLSGIGASNLEWIEIPDADITYPIRNNLAVTGENDEETEDRFRIKVDNQNRLNQAGNIKIPDNIKINYEAQSKSISSSDDYIIGISSMPVGLYDIKVELTFRYSGFRADDGVAFDGLFNEDGTTPNRQYIFTSEIVHRPEIVITDIRFNEFDLDYNELEREAYALYKCNRVLNHYGKLMAYGSNDMPERVFVSHPTFREYFPDFFTLDFETDTDEPIQKITPFMNILVVQSETFTWGLKGIDALVDARSPYQQFNINSIYGTIAPDSVRPVRNQLYFLSKEGIVSLNSLYANDNQYNVKHLDTNIKNIVPQDADAIAIQYDDQYWIHFPNTPNNMTLRYYIEKKAWVKDTYFEYNGLDNNGNPEKSNIKFNGLYRYVRRNDELYAIAHPLQLDDFRPQVLPRFYFDYGLPTDLGEIPRTLFETSYLNQGYPFHYKKYLEQKLDFTIQNEYNLSIKPLYTRLITVTTPVTQFQSGDRIEFLPNRTYNIADEQEKLEAINITYRKNDGTIVGLLYQENPPTVTITNAYEFLGEIFVTWINVLDPTTYENYIIQYKIEDDSWDDPSKVFTRVLPKNTTRTKFTDFTPGVSYSFRVAAQAPNFGVISGTVDIETAIFGRRFNSMRLGTFSDVLTASIPLPTPIGPGEIGEVADNKTAFPTVLTISQVGQNLEFVVRNNDTEEVILSHFLTNLTTNASTSVTNISVAAETTLEAVQNYNNVADGSYLITLIAKADEKDASTSNIIFINISSINTPPLTPTNIEVNEVWDIEEQKFNLEVDFTSNSPDATGFRISVINTSLQTVFEEEYESEDGLVERSILLEPVFDPETTYQVNVVALKNSLESDALESDPFETGPIPPDPVAETPEIEFVDLTFSTLTFRLINKQDPSANLFYRLNNSNVLGALNTSPDNPQDVDEPSREIDITVTPSTTNNFLYAVATDTGFQTSIPASYGPFTVPDAPAPPTDPINVDAVVNDQTITLSWTNTSDIATQSTVQFATDNTFNNVAVNITGSEDGPADRLFTINNFYYARVRVSGPSGNSEWVNFGGATPTAIKVAYIEPPLAPTNAFRASGGGFDSLPSVAGGGGSSTINLEFSDNATDETAYDVQLSTNPTFASAGGFQLPAYSGTGFRDISYPRNGFSWPTGIYHGRLRSVKVVNDPNVGQLTAQSDWVTSLANWPEGTIFAPVPATWISIQPFDTTNPATIGNSTEFRANVNQSASSSNFTNYVLRFYTSSSGGTPIYSWVSDVDGPTSIANSINPRYIDLTTASGGIIQPSTTYWATIALQHRTVYSLDENVFSDPSPRLQFTSGKAN